MGWIIFAAWLVIGFFANIFLHMEENATSAKEKRVARFCGMTCMWIAIGAILVGLLFVIGWVWYYICGGFLLDSEDSFFWNALWGLATLIPLGFIIGLICIICGYNPK